MDQVRQALTTHIANGLAQRGPVAIEHDAALLLNVRSARLQRPAGLEKVWPGGFCLTTDRQLDDVYNGLFGDQIFPVALTMSQLAQLVVAYSEPRVSEQLALQVASGLLDLDFIGRASAIPIELAQLMAMAVAEETITVEQLQLDLRRAFDDARLRLEAGTTDHDALVGSISESRRLRKSAATAQTSRAHADEQRRVELELTRRDEQLKSSAHNDALLRDEIQRTHEHLRASQLENKTQRHEWDKQRTEIRRKHLVDLALLVAGAMAIALFSTGHQFATLTVAVTAVFVWLFGRDWAEGKTSTPLVVALIVTAIATVVPFVRPLIDGAEVRPGPSTTTSTTTVIGSTSVP
jgi:hypothetical protein